MRFPTPIEGVRPPPEQWVDRPEVYSSNAQPTGTNRPRACPTHHQNTHHKHVSGASARVRVHYPDPDQQTHQGLCSQHDTSESEVERVTAAIAKGKHPDPYRTRKLSLSADGTATERLWESRTPPDIHFVEATRCGWPPRHFAVHRAGGSRGRGASTAPRLGGARRSGGTGEAGPDGRQAGLPSGGGRPRGGSSAGGSGKRPPRQGDWKRPRDEQGPAPPTRRSTTVRSCPRRSPARSSTARSPPS